jgi:hypothetical protein
VSTRHGGLLQGIRDTGALPDDNGLASAVDAFHESFLAGIDAAAADASLADAVAVEAVAEAAASE